MKSRLFWEVWTRASMWVEMKSLASFWATSRATMESKLSYSIRNSLISVILPALPSPWVISGITGSTRTFERIRSMISSRSMYSDSSW